MWLPVGNLIQYELLQASVNGGVNKIDMGQVRMSSKNGKLVATYLKSCWSKCMCWFNSFKYVPRNQPHHKSLTYKFKQFLNSSFVILFFFIGSRTDKNAKMYKAKKKDHSEVK